MQPPFSFFTKNNILVLTVEDLVSELVNQEIMRAVDAQIARGFVNFVVDLSSVDYMNSVGINFLIMMKHRSRDTGGQLVVVHASEKVKQLLEITKLQPMFFLTESVEDAMAFFVPQN